MEECIELLEFIKDFLEDNRGNAYRKYIINMFYANLEKRIQQINQKYKALESMKLGKNDKVIKNGE